MFILDTNVLSELVKPVPSAEVQSWLVKHVARGLRTTAICQAEMMVGIAVMPDGKRKQELEAAALRMFSKAFEAKILPFDSDSVSHLAAIVAVRRRQGHQIEFPDALIAAIARRHEAVIVTRNVSDFEGCGIVVKNPWHDL